MENRYPLHYAGNTVAAPRPGRKNRQRRAAHGIGRFEPPHRQPDKTDKVCATSRCLWCGIDFRSYYHTICARCGNCQWCGLVSDQMTDNEHCRYCNNHLPFVYERKYQKMR